MRKLSGSAGRALGIALALLLVVGAVSWLVFSLQQAGLLQRQRTGELGAERSVETAVARVLAHERILARVLATVGRPSQSRWRALSEIVLADQAASGAGFVVPMSERQRTQFERSMGIRVVAVPRPGLAVPASHRGPHWVLTDYVQRPGPPGPWLGADLATNPMRRRLLSAAAATGAQEATPPVPFLSPRSGTGVIVYEAVRSPHGRLLGWVSASYTPGTLIAALAAEAAGLHASIRDGRSVLVADPLADHGRRATFLVAGRPWTVSAWVPVDADSAVPWLVAAIGLLIIGGIVLTLRGLEGRERYALGLVEAHVALERDRQAELEERRRELAEAQSIARVGSWWWDPSDDRSEWSDEMFRLFARDPELGPAVGAAFFAYVHPEDRERTEAAYADAVGDGGHFELEFRVVVAGVVHFVHVLGHHQSGGRYVGTVQDVTALRRAEAETRSLRELGARIIDTAHEAFIACDARGRVVAFNPAAEKLFGWSAQEAIGLTVAEAIVPARMRQRHTEQLARVVAGREPSVLGRPLLLVAVHRSGHELEVETTISKIETQEGPLFSALIRDISERRAREREQALLAAIVSQSDDAIIAKSTEALVVEWNAGAERLYGYTVEEMKEQPIAILVPPEQAGEEQVLLNRVLAGESVTQFETVRIRKDGTRIDVSLSLSPLRESDGTIAGAIVIARDISARRQAERERERAEARLRVTVEHAPTGVALAELPGGRLITVNEAMGSLTGRSPEELQTMALLSLIHPHDGPALQRDLALLASDEDARVEVDLRLLHRDGDVVTAHLAAAAVPAAEGRSLAVLHVLDIGERKRFEGQLQYLADHDVLTSLFNRHRFVSELDRAVAHAERYGSKGAVLLIDLDGFKYVNDTMGHLRGDELITRVGALMRDGLRETDVIARIGGDEFAVIVSQADEQEGVLVAEKLLGTLREQAILLDGERYARVNASIGVSTFGANDRLSADELIVEADIAMYEAKERGKNQVATYDRRSASREVLGPRQSWLDLLSTAVDQRRFELYAQPIRGICADDVPRYELLLRLRGDDEELIPPGTFLYIAERFGLIERIDRHVFAMAARLLRDHHDAGNDISLTVNMSGKTLTDPQLLDDLRSILYSCPIPRSRLVVEVTETAAIVNIDKARAVARALRELGCQFALDDFGAGFASFYYLKHLEFDYLKIDGEFVENLTTNPTDQLVIKSVVDIARGLGAQTIAEFVGDAHALDRLHELGVDYGQGFHLGRPAPLTQALPALV